MAHELMTHGERAASPQWLHQRPASNRSRKQAFNVGVFLGICFSVVGVTWLLLANRVPHLEQFAAERNIALAAAFSLLGIVPTCRFIKSPFRNFLCGVTGWAILTAIYFVAEILFPRLGTRLSAFHLFVLGCMIFGLMAALAWVVNIAIFYRRALHQAAQMGFRYAGSSR
jgi:hypothetical protein